MLGPTLTTSERRHVQPACSPDGERIWFFSGAFGNLDDSELWWFDPRTGKSTAAGGLATSGMQELTPPTEGDWVLVVDGGSLKRPPPGSNP